MADTRSRPTPKTQEQRRTQTRAALLESTLLTLAEYGYARTSTIEIASRAGVSQGSVFRHFPTKEALLAAAADHLLERTAAEVASRLATLAPAPSTHAGLVAALRLLWTMANEPPLLALTELQVAARTDPGLARVLAGPIASYWPEIRDRARIGLRVFGEEGFDAVFAVITDTLRGMAITHRARRAGTDDPDQAVEAVFDRLAGAAGRGRVDLTTYVAVIGGTDADDDALAQAEEVGRRLAEGGAVVVTGGREGIAAAACRGAVEAGGVTIGLLPGRTRTEANPWVTVAVPTGLGETRNALVVMDADAVIAFPGAYGTLSEIGHALLGGRRVVGLGTWAIEGVRPAGSAEAAVALALGR